MRTFGGQYAQAVSWMVRWSTSDAIRTRVGAALERSAKLDALVDRERAQDRRSRQSAS